jgi:hypothetical protein
VIPVIPGVTAWEAAVMGRQGGDQASLFYEFRLEDRIPRDHLQLGLGAYLAHIGGALRRRALIRSHSRPIASPNGSSLRV